MSNSLPGNESLSLHRFTKLVKGFDLICTFICTPVFHHTSWCICRTWFWRFRSHPLTFGFCSLQRHQVSIKRRFMRENKEHAGNPCTSAPFSGVTILKELYSYIDVGMLHVACTASIYSQRSSYDMSIYIYIHTGIGTSYLIIVYWLRIMVFYPIIYTLKYGKHTVTFTFLQASRHQIQHLKFKTHSCVICIYIYMYL